jgi:peptide/nickel transport system permease protein
MSTKERSRFSDFRAGIAPAMSDFRFTLRKIRKSPLSIVGIIIVAIYVGMAIFAPWIAPPAVGTRDPSMIWNDGYALPPKPPGSPVIINEGARNAGYTSHIFGTTQMQYDIFYGCIWGVRTAFRIGVLVIAIALIIGILLGSVSGFYGGVIDELMMRFTDIVLAFPGLILAMALVIALPIVWKIDVGYLLVVLLLFVGPLIIGHFLKIRGLWTFLIGVAGVVAFVALQTFLLGTTIWTWSLELGQLDKVLIALTLVGWPGYTRVIRGEILRIKGEDYIEASKAVGCSDLRVITKHIVPNSIYPVVIMASLDIGSMVLTAAALSFLGIGSPEGYADWGQMISLARNWMVLQYWYVFIIPGIFIFVFVLGWNLLGDAFRDILDPTLRRK